MSADAERALLTRAEELADTSDLAGQVTEILGRGRAARVDQEALGGLVHAVRALAGEESAVLRAVRGRGRIRFPTDRHMFEAIGEAEDALAERAGEVEQLRSEVADAYKAARDDRIMADRQLAAAQAMGTEDPCDGCHAARECAIAEAEAKLADCQAREDCASEARDVLAALDIDGALQAIRTVAEDYIEVYAAVLELVQTDPEALPRDGDFITGDVAADPTARVPARDRDRDRIDDIDPDEHHHWQRQPTEKPEPPIGWIHLSCGCVRSVPWQAPIRQAGDQADCASCNRLAKVLRFWPDERSARARAEGLTETQLSPEDLPDGLAAAQAKLLHGDAPNLTAALLGPTVPGRDSDDVTAGLAAFTASLPAIWEQRRAQARYLSQAYGIDSKWLRHTRLPGRPGDVKGQLSLAEEHLLNQRFTQADRVLAGAADYLRGLPGARQTAARAIEELRGRLRQHLARPRALGTADGEMRPVDLTKHASRGWDCPWCSAPMPADQLLPDWSRGCINPACPVNLTARQLATSRARLAGAAGHQHQGDGQRRQPGTTPGPGSDPVWGAVHDRRGEPADALVTITAG